MPKGLSYVLHSRKIQPFEAWLQRKDHIPSVGNKLIWLHFQKS